ncbi:YjeJ family protein [Kluyvera intermedia]|uniref:YjeJ family protein n=1 Tax=Kluyvera intermedia TaxID=61648 RepID=UPI001F168C1B|nr:YjeJ family protein [Kluyvera intermedia]EKU4733373.1 hypothetical protein [Kluyvera ascorbata]MCE9888433.1 YjeJ family protein [Kluyvera intermedia]
MSITMMGINAGVIRQDKNFIALALKVKSSRNQESLFFLPVIVLKDLLIALESRLSQLPHLSAEKRRQYEKLRDKAVQKMHQNIPSIQQFELEQADINQRVNILSLTQHNADAMTFSLKLQSGKSIELVVDLLQMELLITVMIHAVNNAEMHELTSRLASIMDFLPLYDVDHRDSGNLEYDAYDHPAWKRNLFAHHLAVLYRYTNSEGKEQFCGTLIKTRSKPGSKEVEEISRRLLDFSPRLKKLSGTSCQVFVRMLSSEKNKTFTPDDCMQALYQLQQNAEKARD